MYGSRVVGGIAADRRIFIIKDCLTRRIQAEQLRCWIGGRKSPNNRVIDEIVERRILVNTATEWTVDTLVHLKIPNFRRSVGVQGQAIFSWTGVIPQHARRHLKRTGRTIVEEEQRLIEGDRGSMLSGRRNAIRGDVERELGKRGEFVPFLGRIA